MKKSIITLLLIILMSMVGVRAFAYDIAVKNADGVTIYYNFYGANKDLSVTYCLGWNDAYHQDYPSNVVIPESVNYEGKTYKVTRIGDRAFNSSSMTSVTIPNSVTYIGEYAFSGCHLTSITIPSSIKEIGISAFELCSRLEKVIVPDIAAWCSISFGDSDSNPLSNNTPLYSKDNYEIAELVIPNGATKISNYAFFNCRKLTSVTIPNSVKEIGDCAFIGCSGLTTITIPNSVTFVGGRAFVNCTGLTSVTIGSENGVGETAMANDAFSGCKSLKSAIIGSNVTIFDDEIGNNYTNKLVAFKDTPIASVTFNCKNIGLGFQNNETIENVVIGNAVQTFEDYAFKGCCRLKSVSFHCKSIGRGFFYLTSIEKVIIGSEVTSIDNDAFAGCSGLKKVIVNDLSAWCKISFGSKGGTGYSNPLYFAQRLYSDEYTEITDLVIPNNVKSISDYAFVGCKGLVSATIPNSVTSIGEAAFWQCKGMISVNIPGSVTTIGNYAFARCGLSSVNISNGITKISVGMFSECPIRTITIPNSVTTIENYAFLYCEHLLTVVIGNGIKSIGRWAFHVDNTYMYSSDIYCYAKQIPTIDDETFQKGRTSYVTTLHVPSESVANYKADNKWRYSFKQIVPLTDSDPQPTRINSIKVDEQEGKWYTLDGKYIEQPRKGLNIVRMSNGKTKKVLVK